MERAVFMTERNFLDVAAGYCAVSGSPVSARPGTRYKMRLQKVDGSGREEGFMYYCCWPCVCDTQGKGGTHYPTNAPSHRRNNATTQQHTNTHTSRTPLSAWTTSLDDTHCLPGFVMLHCCATSSLPLKEKSSSSNLKW